MALVLALSLAACAQKPAETPVAAAGPAKLSGAVSTDGSTSMEKVIGALGEAFMQANSYVTFTYNPTGSGSGTCSGFEEIVEVEDKCQYRQELSSTGDVITTVAQNPGAIGYASLASFKDTVKAVKVGGVTPSDASVKDGTYAIQRPFVLATKTGVQLGDAAQAFFDYVTSADANGIIVAAGVVPAK